MRSIDFGNINFFQMQLCLSIQEHGSFTRAASVCHVTQPTISKRVSELESQLGLLLFIRGKNTSVRPTPAGKVILEEWKTILTQMEHSLQKGYNAQANMGPTIVIGSYPSADADLYLTPLINDYIEKRPDVDFRFLYSGAPDHVNGLLSGETDVVFMPTFRQAMFKRAPIMSYQVLTCNWYAGMLPGNPLANKETLSFADLQHQRFVLPSPQLFGDYYSFIEDACKNHGFLPQISFLTKNHMSLPMNVHANDEVFIIDGHSRLLKDHMFKFVSISGIKSGIIMAVNENNAKLVVHNFRRYATTFFREMSSEEDEC